MGQAPSSGMHERSAREDTLAAKAQRNFTDGDNWIMPRQGGFIAGYDGQIAADATHRVITTHQPG
jgi:hypothetical protein